VSKNWIKQAESLQLQERAYINRVTEHLQKVYSNVRTASGSDRVLALNNRQRAPVSPNVRLRNSPLKCGLPGDVL
jgi:hypothetical protein